MLIQELLLKLSSELYKRIFNTQLLKTLNHVQTGNVMNIALIITFIMVYHLHSEYRYYEACVHFTVLYQRQLLKIYNSRI